MTSEQNKGTKETVLNNGKMGTKYCYHFSFLQLVLVGSIMFFKQLYNQMQLLALT